MELRLLSDWSPGLSIALASGLAVLAWLIYWRETRSTAISPINWMLPSLRALAVLMIALTLMEPAFESRTREGTPGNIVFALDASRSMQFEDSNVSSAKPQSRFEQSTSCLIDPTLGLIPGLIDSFHITVQRIGQKGVLEIAWTSDPATAAGPIDPDWNPTEWSAESALGDALLQVAGNLANAESSDAKIASSVVVLFSDGQSNAGTAVLEAAATIGKQAVRVFTVGLGNATQANDLVVRSASGPPRVFRSDTYNGTINVAESIPTGSRYVAEVCFRETILWQQECISEGLLSREIEFSFPVPTLFDLATATLPAQAKYASLPAKLDVRLRLRNGANTQNNDASLFTSVTAQNSKILLIDGRSRWESRYLKNLFSRDPAWELITDLSHPSLNSNSGTSPLPHFPASREDFFDLNLIILGDIDAGSFSIEQLNWLREFVEFGGGGLILIDGARGHLQGDGFAALRDLFPIQWLPSAGEAINALPKNAKLTTAGESLDALQLTPSSTDDKSLAWLTLPPLQFVAQVQPLAGSEVLVSARSEIDETPLFVSRQFGSGRVLYAASDETWKWRYKVADRIHTRLWNQLARWVMRTPLSIQGDYLAIDTGRPSYELGEAVAIRCQLRYPNEQRDTSIKAPSAPRAATAVIRRGTEVIARLPMLEDPSVPGNFRVSTGSLPAGDYSVQIEAAGFPKEALEIESSFAVLEPESPELQETSRDEAVLTRIAELTGGTYVDAQDSAQLLEQILPLSGGKFVQSTTIIWQSYWWFVPAIMLLIIEWILRKRAGLM